MIYRFRTNRVLPILWFHAFFTTSIFAQVSPLLHAHAHNDYVHAKPLFDALDNGFTSIEVDVFLHRGQLRVAHEPFFLGKRRTLEELYLTPLCELLKNNNGRVFSHSTQPITLMIDIKSAGLPTYNNLKVLLEKYVDLVTVYNWDSVVEQRAVNILISGNCPAQELKEKRTNPVSADLDLKKLANIELGSVATRFSGNWSDYFLWRGKGEMPTDELKKLRTLVNEVHRLKKQIRFYQIPDNPVVWQLLLDEGVDWINTDRLSDFRIWYEQQRR